MFANLDIGLAALRAYPDILQAAGVAGSVIYVGGFALVQSGKTCGNGAAYSASKIIAAVLVLLSLVDAFNLSAFLIQVGFIGFGMFGLIRQVLCHKRTQPAKAPTQPAAYVPHAPETQDVWQVTSDLENHPRARADDTPVRPFPDAAAPAL